LFTQQDLDNLRIIYHLVKERGYTLQGAREKIRSNRDEVARHVEVIDALTRIRSFLLEIKEHI
jgi:DNA-binding transcriptional MerR regulator